MTQLHRRELLTRAAASVLAAGMPRDMKAGALQEGADFDFQYPTFPKTTLVRFRQASDFITDAAYSVVDAAVNDNPYGNATSPQITGASGLKYLIRPSALTTTRGVDIRNGQVRINYKPVTNVTSNLSAFEVRLFSSANPASPGPNYHKLAFAGTFKSQCTGNGAASGRWQSVAASTVAYSANGTGSDLSSFRFAQILGFGVCSFELGDIEFYLNPRSKGAVIIRMDDADPSAYTVMKGILDPLGAAGVLMPGAIGKSVGAGGNLSIAQYQTLLADGWQSASQCYSTENNVIVDGWTRDQRMAEYAAARNFVTPYGRRRDTYDGSFYSNVGFRDMTAWPELRDSFRTLSNFVNGSAAGTPLSVSEVFPFADPKNIVCLNLNSWGNVSDIYESHLFAALEQTRACNGVLIIGMHNEMKSTKYVSAIQKVGKYVSVLHSDQMEFTTLRKILAPYNGDTLVG